MKKTKQKRKKIWENAAHSFEEADKWDRKFWEKAGANERFYASWIMLKDFYKIRGEKVNASKFRLRRHVENIKHA